ncbi:MAG: glutamine-hydrolyzing carbamoyl-phosphate synthase small subunit [Clostridiales Family XIII bacterium]|jgi:carbamoyl-phosphate synthase small subunit|nr:glutamine-hydrolyzing carbamoyl-phosphate synthase small subunit [Clostridiales Family XIII bacterium]
MNGLLYLEDGTAYTGEAFGAKGTGVGELVFNTSMTGYQKLLTDPSYKGQIINMTYPLIGNYGISGDGGESAGIHAFGFVAKDISLKPSSRKSVMSIGDWLRGQGVPGLCDVDTRSVTKRVRSGGTIKCVISTEGISVEEARKHCEETALRPDWMKDAGTKEVIRVPGGGFRVAVMDFGVKQNILRVLSRKGCDLVIFPYGTSPAEILASKPDGILLSNGPGDPSAATEAVAAAKAVIGKVPVFGICLGHQVLALACGGKTYKLKYGHRGGNHGVYDRYTGRSAITSQNHGFAVDAESILNSDLDITHLNLNDGTVEGLRHKTLPMFSVQFHPEASPGPNDSEHMFDRFLAMMKGDNT